MASRFPNSSNLHQRDPRSALFGGYDGGSTSLNNTNKTAKARTSPSPSPVPPNYGYGVPHSRENGSGGLGSGLGDGGFRVATPNKRGQYSDAVLNELESQNDGQVEGILGKVRLLKDMTNAIGDEIRSSTALTEKMNDSFDGARVRLRGTMNRMLVMAERTGVGWKVWGLFILAVVGLFAWVWLF